MSHLLGHMRGNKISRLRSSLHFCSPQPKIQFPVLKLFFDDLFLLPLQGFLWRQMLNRQTKIFEKSYSFKRNNLKKLHKFKTNGLWVWMKNSDEKSHSVHACPYNLFISSTSVPTLQATASKSFPFLFWLLSALNFLFLTTSCVYVLLSWIHYVQKSYHRLLQISCCFFLIFVQHQSLSCHRAKISSSFLLD